MKYEIEFFTKWEIDIGYYVHFPTLKCNHDNLRDVLDIDHDNYQRILTKYKAIFIGYPVYGYYFNDRSDAERFANSEDLIPYFMMNKLIT